jgi:chlorophyll/bacteriochlorophyll a synthase
MWAFACGAISAGASWSRDGALVLLGLILAGPMVCATSQAVNDWFDRHVDAINEPHRPIPSGRIPGQWGLWIAVLWTALSLLVATRLGTIGFIAALFGLLLAWAYSAPPWRLKQNGWFGNAACGLCYEGVAWVTGAAVVAAQGQALSPLVFWFALLYSIAAHGIMTLNDFKAIKGDEQMGIRSLPVQLGVFGAARAAALIMLVPQWIAMAMLIYMGSLIAAAVILVLMLIQVAMLRRFLRDPVRQALWYSGFGVPVLVTGMMVCAFAIRGHHVLA